MSLGRLGFYRELPHGDPSGPSVGDVAPLPAEVKAQVLDYFDSL